MGAAMPGVGVAGGRAFGAPDVEDVLEEDEADEGL